MNNPPPRNEDEHRRLGGQGGCGIVCISIAAGIIMTSAVALIDDVTGWLAVPNEAVVIAFVVNGTLVAAGSAFGGWASNERLSNRVAFGLLAAGTGIVVYIVLFSFFGYFVLMDYI